VLALKRKRIEGANGKEKTGGLKELSATAGGGGKGGGGACSPFVNRISLKRDKSWGGQLGAKKKKNFKHGLKQKVTPRQRKIILI